MSAPIDKYPFVALVTGANRGLGLEFIRQIAFGRSAAHPVVPGFTSPETGASDVPSFVPDNAVVIATARDPASATALNALAAEAPDRVFVAKLEATDSADIAALATLVDEKFGRLDLLVNNAGIAGSVPSLDPSILNANEVMSVINTNAIAPIALSCALLPALQRTLTHKLAGAAPLVPKLRGDVPNLLPFVLNKESLVAPLTIAAEAVAKEVASGPRLRTPEELTAISQSPVKVIFISTFLSSISLSDNSLNVGYRTSKAALNSLVRSFAVSAPGIAVAPLHPGWVATDMGSMGGNAPLTPAESIADMLSVVDRLHAGELSVGVWVHDGSILPY